MCCTSTTDESESFDFERKFFPEYTQFYIMERYLRLRGESEVVITGLTRKVAELITPQLAKARFSSDYLANASFFLNFG